MGEEDPKPPSFRVVLTPLTDPPGLRTRSGEPMPPGYMVEIAPPGDNYGARVAAIDNDARARRALSLLETASGRSDAATVAAHMEQLFSAVAGILRLPGASEGSELGISPDSAREYQALVRRMHQALVHRAFASGPALKRRRTYLEARIIRQAEKCDGSTSPAAIESAAQAVVDLTAQDAHTCSLVDALVDHEAELVACVRSAVARRPRNGRFPPPGTRNKRDVDKYEAAFTALCRALQIPSVAANTRAAARSRISPKK